MSNREIKFRAWDVTLGKSIDGGNPITQQGKLLTVTRSLTYEGVHSREVALMQYTGLKDKNGVEIYEGDVVGKEVGAFQPLRKIRRDCVVEWQRKGKESGMWELLLIKDERVNITKSYYEPFGLGCEPQNYEVIGNIHENPELLK